ncbi:BrxE family protein [Opitutaceae bacterium TAV4]|nr:BrxE family protein [Opitutaceae bacterium TAV4]RRK00199.1 BrxE family protein [Opitutaceae bacterium TAV3]RRK01990.1 BrxE family protein [Opitutaceae bacterium TAV3]
MNQDTYISTILEMRKAVAYLGERSQKGWWNTQFLHHVGFQYLKLIYPQSAASAALLAAGEAACQIHDERIGRGRVVHLFRMPHECESGLNAMIRGLSLDTLAAQCSPEMAYAVLEKIAAKVDPVRGTGPLQVGPADEAISPHVLARIAATYAAGFEAETPVFPYLA